MNKFLKDLEKELKKLKVNTKEIKEILEDHKEMIEAAQKEGLSEEEIEFKFGNPEKLAKDLKEEDKGTTEKKEDFILNDVTSCVNVDTSDYNLVKTFPVVSNEIAVNFSLISEDLRFTTYEGESIQVYEKDIENLDTYVISFKDDVFTLERERKIRIFGFSSKGGEFIVLLPKNTNIKKISYATVSGDSHINGISSKDLKIKSTSGDVEITNLTVEKIKISSVSGDMEMARVEGNSFEVSLVSGDLELEKAVIEGTMYFHSVSGDIKLSEVECKEATLKTVSGDLKGKEFYPNEVTLKSVSGDINVKNSDKSREIIVLSKKTLSGDINFN